MLEIPPDLLVSTLSSETRKVLAHGMQLTGEGL